MKSVKVVYSRREFSEQPSAQSCKAIKAERNPAHVKLGSSLRFSNDQSALAHVCEPTHSASDRT